MGKELHLCFGDLLKQKTEAIVNSIGRKIGMTKGLAEVIIRKAGSSVKAECKSFKDRNHELPVGDCFSTKGGNLPFNFIIHASGPRGREDALLEKTIRSCLKKARSLGCKSISFPLISTGVLGFPIADCVRITLNVANEFLAANYVPNVVRVVCRDKKTFDDILSFFNFGSPSHLSPLTLFLPV